MGERGGEEKENRNNLWAIILKSRFQTQHHITRALLSLKHKFVHISRYFFFVVVVVSMLFFSLCVFCLSLKPISFYNLVLYFPYHSSSSTSIWYQWLRQRAQTVIIVTLSFGPFSRSWLSLLLVFPSFDAATRRIRTIHLKPMKICTWATFFSLRNSNTRKHTVNILIIFSFRLRLYTSCWLSF